MEKMKSLVRPVNGRIAAAKEEVQGLRDALVSKGVERQRVGEAFFVHEVEAVRSMLPLLQGAVDRVQATLAGLKHKEALCGQWDAGSAPCAREGVLGIQVEHGAALCALM